MASLRAADRAELWALARRFHDTDEAYFAAGLAKHREVVRFRERRGALVGLAAIDVLHHPLPPTGELATLLFTSNVVIEPAYRGHNLVQRAGARTFLETRFRYPRRRIFWLFDTFSYKSYLLLARNFETFWPHPSREMPRDMRRFRDEVAARHYGPAFDPSCALVRRSGRKRLRPETAPIGERELHNPHVRHFVELNPGHHEGDMLVCLAPLDLGNWSTIVRRALRR